jgi:hypothetical protein
MILAEVASLNGRTFAGINDCAVVATVGVKIARSIGDCQCEEFCILGSCWFVETRINKTATSSS